jgi:AcrR family transcriptional regulator
MLSRMGHREQLLEGAKRALMEKGHAGTTARDIVAASGTNLASIGYHFGSKDALLTAAMIEAIGEWGDEVEAILRTAVDPDAQPIDRLEVIWNGVVESVRTQRKLWVASAEILTVAEHEPALREQLAEALEEGRKGLTAMVTAGAEDVSPERAHALGSLCLAVLQGLMLQQLIDPERASSGTELASAIRALAATL